MLLGVTVIVLVTVGVRVPVREVVWDSVPVCVLVMVDDPVPD